MTLLIRRNSGPVRATTRIHGGFRSTMAGRSGAEPSPPGTGPAAVARSISEVARNVTGAGRTPPELPVAGAAGRTVAAVAATSARSQPALPHH